MLLKGKIAAITGGTRGIGFAIARKYLENGASVVVFGSSEESAQNAVNKLKEINPDFDVSGDFPNLSDPESIEKTLNKIVEKYGKLDIMVNNAGVSDKEATLNIDGDHFKKIIDINVNSVFYGAQQAAKIMKEQGFGCIISTSSMVSKNGQPSGVAYPTSKFAINGLTVSLARELGKYGIRVNAVAPGIINTDMVKELPKEMIEPMVSHIPLKRIGEPEDIGNAYVFLASDLASYVTGEILHVDGGMTV